MLLKKRLLALSIALGTLSCAAAGIGADNPSEKWAAAIAKFEQKDKESPPPKNGIVFVGSSSIVGWDVAKWFPDRQAINRGFGGSQTIDSVYYADRIVVPYEPRVVVLYAGDNDIAQGKSPEQVFQDWQAFVAKVHAKLPETKIVYVAIKPSIKRWALIEKVRAANSLVAESCAENDKLVFLDIDKPMLGEDGTPRKELFKDDGLHLNETGYQLWSDLLRPELAAGE